MNRSRRFAQILCIVLAVSMVFAILLSVFVEWPWALPIVAAFAAGGFVVYRLRSRRAKK